MKKSIFLSPILIFAAIFFIFNPNIVANAVVTSGSHCTNQQYNTDVRVKSGVKTYLCTGAPDGFYWTELGKGGGSAHITNDKSALLPRNSTYPSTIHTGTICPVSQFLKTVKQGNLNFICIEGPPDGRARWKIEPPIPLPAKPIAGNPDFMRGYTMITQANVGTLQAWNFVAFLSPDGTLSKTNALDWCNQLPRVIVGLLNVVNGHQGLVDWVRGCIAGARKVGS